ncbi:uncharacterized protein LOC142221086 [Haematobia irritans]|uniref:Putative secreted protein n=1 Tax=Haematobia irritans TaxID=7368 RepID=A0A1L8EIL3_HAEIR
MTYRKILTILAFIAFAKAQQNSLVNYNTHSQNDSYLRDDDYLNAHRRQYAANIWYYDLQITQFKQAYLDRAQSLDFQKEPLINEIIRADESLYPLTLLSEFSKSCVQKYKSLIPSMSWAKLAVDNCISTATSQATNVVSSMSSTNRTLQTYYSTNFEKDVTACQTKFNASMSTDYTMCLANTVAATNAYTLNNQKTFSNQMQSATNTANVYIKTANECIFAVHNTTLTKISEANTRIDGCIQGRDDCSQCSGHFCPDVYYMPAAYMDPKNATMVNPFYGRNETGNCLMLDIF